MKKVVALLLTLSMLISANTFVFADSAETGNSTESYQQQDNSENQIVSKYVIIRICQQLYFSDTLFS